MRVRAAWWRYGSQSKLIQGYRLDGEGEKGKLTQAIFQARRCGVEQPTSLTQTKEDWTVIPRMTRTNRAWIRRTYQMKRSVRREDIVVAILQAESSMVSYVWKVIEIE